MVAARLWGFTFWQEIWFEYAVGFALGWFLFQTWAMRLHGNGWLMSIGLRERLARAVRGRRGRDDQ